MNLPNKITVLRFVLTGVALVLLYLPGFEAKAGALAFFVLAALSDQLDGYIARTRNLETFFGKIFDQTADKVLVNLFWLAFLDLRLLPFWLVALNLFREIVVVSVRGAVAEKGVIMKSEKSGKYKAALQMLVIFAGLSLVVLTYPGSLPQYASDTLLWLGVATVAVSYWALIDFFVKNKDAIFADA
ncbi:MAG: CDP-alcohol phosphatidyltransferase family protein [Candidatus Aenigmatarchaeota archaeon]|nr:MAG: CDP-alcohol phosphatidyltransferase family protein [Candidatus Aenigmarchaeota archaeon]